MSDEARGLRDELERAQGALRTAREEFTRLEGEVRDRKRLRAQLESARLELAQLQLREKDLVNTLLETKHLAAPTDEETQRNLAALRESERASGGGAITVRRMLAFGPLVVGSGVAWAARDSGMNLPLVGVILAALGLFGLVGATVGFGDRS